MFSVLTDRRFRRLFAAQVVALVGTGLLTVALGLLAYDLAGARAGAVLGTALAIKMAAYVLVAPAISAIAYRLPKRVLMVGSDVVRAGIAMMLPFVDQIWQIYVLIFVLQAASATFTPTFQSVIPAVLAADKDYIRGLSLSRLAYDLETLVSPVLAAVLLTVVTYNHLFLGTVVGFLVSGLLVSRTSLPAVPVSSRQSSFRQRAALGVQSMAHRPILRALLALNLAVAAATALVVVNTVVYTRDILGASASATAVLLACYGGGSMVIALLMPRLITVAADRRVMLTGAVTIALALSAVAVLLRSDPSPLTGWVGFAILWLVLGAGASAITTPSARLLRYETDDDDRAAVFAAQFSLSHACFFLTYPLAGWLGVLTGQSAATAVLAVLAVGAAGSAARLWPVTTPRVGPSDLPLVASR